MEFFSNMDRIFMRGTGSLMKGCFILGPVIGITIIMLFLGITNMADPALRNGNQPAVQVLITYLDRGNTTVIVEYDSSDNDVNKDHPHGAGVFKEADRFPVRDSGLW